MRAARLSSSPRLQRVQHMLRAGGEYTTLEIMRQARVCAVSAVIAELRANGADIDCRQEHRPTGRVWLYRMLKPAEESVRG